MLDYGVELRHTDGVPTKSVIKLGKREIEKRASEIDGKKEINSDRKRDKI